MCFLALFLSFFFLICIMERFIKYTDSYNVTAFGFISPFIACLFSHQEVSDSATPRTAAHQASLSLTISQSLPKFMSIALRCHPTISSSVTLFPFCFQSFPASGSFPTSQLFTSGGQSVGASASASVLPMSMLLHMCFLLYPFLSFSFWFLFFRFTLLF